MSLRADASWARRRVASNSSRHSTEAVTLFHFGPASVYVLVYDRSAPSKKTPRCDWPGSVSSDPPPFHFGAIRCDRTVQPRRFLYRPTTGGHYCRWPSSMSSYPSVIYLFGPRVCVLAERLLFRSKWLNIKPLRRSLVKCKSRSETRCLHLIGPSSVATAVATRNNSFHSDRVDSLRFISSGHHQRQQMRSAIKGQQRGGRG